MSGAAKWLALKDHVKVGRAAAIQLAANHRHPQLEAYAERILRLARQPLTLAVMGEFSAGKSSFLNRLLGQAVLPVSILPKTATLTRLVFGEHAEIEVDYRFDDTVVTKSVTRKDFVKLQHAAKINDPLVMREIEAIQEVRVSVPHQLLQRLHLIDTPGFNHDQSMDEKTLASLDAADIVLWIADYTQAAKQSEFERLRMLKAHGKRVWLVVNKGDVSIEGSEAHNEAVRTLGHHLHEIGFLDFFESDEVLLISCKAMDSFWDGLFQQLIARLNQRVLYADIQISVQLIDDTWQQLGESLSTEQAQAAALRDCSDALEHQLCGPRVVEAECATLLRHVRRPLAGLLNELRKLKPWSHESNLPVVVAFGVEHCQSPLDKRLDELKRNYVLALLTYRRRHFVKLIQILSDAVGLLPGHHTELRRQIGEAIAYCQFQSNVEWNQDERHSAATLPAVGQAVEMLSHLAIQFGDVTWKFALDVIEDGVPTLGREIHPEKKKYYRRIQLTTALMRDLTHDIMNVCNDLVIAQVATAIRNQCDMDSKDLTTIHTTWDDSRSVPDAPQ